MISAVPSFLSLWVFFCLQLACLATYENADCIAVYHYCRAVFSRFPFKEALGNLFRVFAKAATAFEAPKQQEQKSLQQHPAKKMLRDGHRKLEKHESERGEPAIGRVNVCTLTSFLARFVQLHGLLFNWATAMHCSCSEEQSGEQASWASELVTFSTAHMMPEEEENTFNGLLKSMLDEFDIQLAAGAFTDELLVRLLAICVFSVHYAVKTEENLLCELDLKNSDRNPLNTPIRTIYESYALQLLYSFVNRYPVPPFSGSMCCFLLSFFFFLFFFSFWQIYIGRQHILQNK
jgi:hypothetical protein